MTTPPPPVATWIRFVRGERAWVIDPAVVLEVSRHRRRSPVPGATHGVVGASSIRGLVVPLFDLDPRLDRGDAHGVGQHLVFIGTDTPLFGIVADRCEPVTSDAAPAPLPPDHPWVDDALVHGQWPDGTLVVDTAQLLVDRRLYATDAPSLTTPPG